MKMFLSMAIVLIALFALACPAQTQSTYQIYWNANPASENVSGYAVYLEGRSSSTGFTLVNGLDYVAAFDVFQKADVVQGTGEIVYDIVLPNDGKYYIAGVIAYTSIGVKSKLSATLTPYRVDMQPSQPGGVGIRKKP